MNNKKENIKNTVLHILNDKMCSKIACDVKILHIVQLFICRKIKIYEKV